MGATCMTTAKYFVSLLLLVALCGQAEASGQLSFADSIKTESLENQVILSQKKVLAKAEETPQKITLFFDQIQRINNLEQKKNHSYTLVESGQLALFIIFFITLAAMAILTLLKRKETMRLSALRNQEQTYRQVLNKRLPENVILNFLEDENLEPVKVKDCIVLFIEVNEDNSSESPKKRFELINEVFQNAEALFIEFGLIRIKSSGDQLVAICKRGNLTPSQQANNTMLCAVKLRENVLDYEGGNLSLRAGISYGDALMGFVGSNTLCFDIWGECIEEAAQNLQSANREKIKVSKYIMRSVDKDLFKVESNLSETNQSFEL